MTASAIDRCSQRQDGVRTVRKKEEKNLSEAQSERKSTEEQSNKGWGWVCERMVVCGCVRL